MSLSYSDLARLDALERRVQELEGQVRLLMDMMGQRSLSSGPSTSPSGQGWDVVLVDYPMVQKISVIKVIREVTGLGLKEAKDLSENLPGKLKQSISRSEAEALQRQFDPMSARIELVPSAR
jgi:ribosomal protein L7/L12